MADGHGNNDGAAASTGRKTCTDHGDGPKSSYGPSYTATVTPTKSAAPAPTQAVPTGTAAAATLATVTLAGASTNAPAGATSAAQARTTATTPVTPINAAHARMASRWRQDGTRSRLKRKKNRGNDDPKRPKRVMEGWQVRQFEELYHSARFDMDDLWKQTL
ncbi:hypothetical protein Sste5346_008523 [Sporothrix stenoceras]|uniref:Uncharacterized protein n=1 Tax=Sporothrix stenoceras TaxID=5173 RepID=A0ABR3YP53_9PEZI